MAGQDDFQDFDNQAGQIMLQNDTGPMDTRMDGNGGLGTSMLEQIAPIATTRRPQIDSLLALDAQIQYLQTARALQHARDLEDQQRNLFAQNRSIIPPTPNSVKMHGGNAQFYSQSDPQQQAMYERFRMQVKEQEVCLV